MKRILSKTFRLFFLIFLALILFLGGTLLFGALNDYQPELILPIESARNSNQKIITDSTVTFLTWNIGFGGLGKESDFFMNTESMYWSSEKKVTTDEKYVEKNTKGIADFIEKTEADFFLLQEVDVNSKRSYFKNQFESIADKKDGFAALFAPNYNIPRNPVPIFQPWDTYGKVLSGLATYSRFQPKKSTRFQLPGEFPFPQKIFHLDRCAAVHRFETDFGKELVVLNIHNSAFDKDGSMKAQQLKFLKKLVLEEYEKDNYVILGGDWNLCPPGFDLQTFRKTTFKRPKTNIDADLLPEGWKWVYDPTVPTIRSSSHPFDSEKTFVTLIDCFLVSPNVIVEEVKGIDMGFDFSDHQPVRMRVRLGN